MTIEERKLLEEDYQFWMLTADRNYSAMSYYEEGTEDFKRCEENLKDASAQAEDIRKELDLPAASTEKKYDLIVINYYPVGDSNYGSYSKYSPEEQINWSEIKADMDYSHWIKYLNGKSAACGI
jgi:hypothetical protein